MKLTSLFIALLLAGMLSAQPTYFPYTTMAEQLGSNTCGGCAVAWQGLQVPLAQTHNGEFFVAKLYTQSGDLSPQIVLDRFDYYEVTGIPAVIFNGKTRVNGSGDGIADGSQYISALNQYRYASSPLHMQFTDFSRTTGNINGSITMVSPDTNISNAKVVYYLLEDNLPTTETHVVRGILYDDFELSGEGSTFNFNKTFTINPAWNAANLWASASVQLSDRAIVQNASTLPMPDYNLRAAMNWNPNINGAVHTYFSSQDFWLFNQGGADNYTTRIVVDSAPAGWEQGYPDGWSFGYCDDNGMCYTWDYDSPLSLSRGESKAFHITVMAATEGVANFRFVITSPNIGSYSIPFRFATEGAAADDEVLVAPPLRLGGIYPNPVKQHAAIELYNDKSSSSASIDIYNLKGQKVQSMEALNLKQGTNLINLQADSALPTGVYFLKLAGTDAPARKFILLK